MSRIAKVLVLSDDDLTTLTQLVTKGKASVRKINRARVLLLFHQKQTPQQVSTLLGLSVVTVYNVRNRYPCSNSHYGLDRLFLGHDTP